MKKIFVDTNILLDLLFQRRGFFLDAKRLFNYSKNRNINIFISAISINTIYYLLQKKFTKEHSKHLLEYIYDITDILPFDENIIFLAHQSSFKDLEDAFQYFTAKEHHIPLLITRNIKDFTVDDLSVLSPQQFLEIMAK
ncbi:type II toxin-antitoxin system VapC family toxin [Capnocytophaga granulosa]|uniref:type II toxin-antitoxin system VapC family toxin n=1 Tax=Capnocytophaga granulosa TaxID=45242 RepID=UPI0023F2C859|nr:PIN domain-containing protein [Capnocytophaga granulosa]